MFQQMLGIASTDYHDCPKKHNQNSVKKKIKKQELSFVFKCKTK